MEILLDAGNTFDPDSHFLFWKPDTPALVEPDDMPWRLDPGNDLVLNMHLKPSGKQEVIAPEVGIYFTDKPPTKQPMLLQLDRDDALDIPAGDAHFVVEDSLALPVDVEALGVYPHAHYLGKDMQAWAILPNGQKKWLVWIRDWDIDRQSVYRYREPVALPKARSCTCATFTTTPQSTRAIRTTRRSAYARAIAPKTKWPTSGCRCCRCT